MARTRPADDPTIPHGTLTGYRGTIAAGGTRPPCRCSHCRREHAEYTQEQRRQAQYGPDGPMSSTVRAMVLAGVRRGMPVTDAAVAAGVTHQAVYAAVRVLPDFAEAFAAAETRT